jgi:acetyl coenzyme A synthetase (ADP forming)-like protein
VSTGANLSVYPEEWEIDAVLADGATVHIRPIRPTDAAALVTFHSGLSFETVYRRFFSVHPTLSEEEVARFTTVDYQDRFALVATLEDEIVAVARYDRTSVDTAEVAFVVSDAEQGRGIGALLLEQLAGAARERGIRAFTAETMLGNHAMLGVFRDAGFGMHTTTSGGIVVVELAIDETTEALAAADERERRAEVASVRRVLWPETIAVIGAGRRPGTIGHEVFRNLLLGGFAGTVYPVNPAAATVAGVHAYARVSDVPRPVDVAVVVVPASAVIETVDECGAAHVRGLVVISAGFGEVDDAGIARQADLVRAVRRHGMRLVGPNCMGVVNTAPGVQMNATFAPVQPAAGSVGFLSQSGALGIAVLEQAVELGLGVSTFVSVGNKADVSGNDLLQYWESDPSTRIILLYLESFGNPRKFARIARRVARSKPIVAVKSGRTSAGAIAARSHTAAAAAPEVAADALFRQAGVIRVKTMAEMFDVAVVLTNQAPPAGQRVAIVGNSGGPGILAADACEDAGLLLAELTDTTVASLAAFLPAAASIGNPLDLIASATAEQYERALDLVLADAGVDSVVVIFTPPLVTRAEDVAARVVGVARRHAAKPVVATFLGGQHGSGTLSGAAAGPAVPVFPFPEQAVHALGHAAAYGGWLSRPFGRVPEFADVEVNAARAVVTRALGAAPAEGQWMAPDDAAALLEAFEIPAAAARVVADADEAARVAGELGFPVALKAASPDIVHKSDVGAVALDLSSPDAVGEAYRAMAARLGGAMGGAVVQAMAPRGIETIVGVVQDPSFGPLVMFGLGGVATDVLGDRAFRILPLTDLDAAELVRSVRAAPLLFGHRGTPAVDVSALEDVILRVAALADTVPEVAELDLNPVVASPRGVLALDAKVRLRPVPSGPGPLSRKLR